MDVWINGEFVSDEDARVSAFDAGFQHGIGIFETMIARNGRVFRADQHMDRLLDSAETLMLTDRLHAGPLIQAVHHALEHNAQTDARVRLTLTGGNLNALRSTGEGPSDPTIVIVVQPPTEYPESFFAKGVSALLASGRLNPWEFTAGHKTLDYWNRIAALQSAASVGAGEALWLTPDAKVASGSVSNLFFIADGILRRPPARGEQLSGEIVPPILPGITRRAIIELAQRAGITVEEALPTLEDVMGADEVFLTNSSWHVLPVTGLGLTVKSQDPKSEQEAELRHHPIADGEVGSTTADLRAALLELIEQETREKIPS
jgi:branched-chain amino acid aminotransferase